MWALSYPGRSRYLGEDVRDSHTAAMRIGEALLDLETSYFTPDAPLAQALAQTGAQPQPADRAAYHFYPTAAVFAHPDDLAPIRQARIGDYLYPDQSATLIVACHLGSGLGLRLHGPGIQGTDDLRVGGLSTTFWDVRAERLHYPLGFDLFLIDGGQVVGLPRTTVVQVIEPASANAQESR
jgi:alpha-D-ribose 1-methylphosphonate 5-triphosphate synthase subunit PhnH